MFRSPRHRNFFVFVNSVLRHEIERSPPLNCLESFSENSIWSIPYSQVLQMNSLSGREWYAKSYWPSQNSMKNVPCFLLCIYSWQKATSKTYVTSNHDRKECMFSKDTYLLLWNNCTKGGHQTAQEQPVILFCFVANILCIMRERFKCTWDTDFQRLTAQDGRKFFVICTQRFL